MPPSTGAVKHGIYRYQDERRMSKFMQYAIAASAEALKDSGWLPNSDEEKETTVSRAPNTAYMLTWLTGLRAYA